MADLDLQGDARKLFRAAYDTAKDHQQKRNQQYGYDYLLYRAFVDMSNRDENIPQISVPKIWSIVETNSAREMKALFGAAPFIESETQYDDMKEVVELQNIVLHDFLKRGNFYFEATLANKIKGLYGTSFMESEPFRKWETYAVPHEDGLGGYNTEYKRANQLHIRINTLAPWEVMFDPLWRDLETPEGCNWAIKMSVTSRRLIRQQAMNDPEAYPGLDLDALGRGGLNTEYYNEHIGYQILQDYGLPKPRTDNDDDICMLFRLETPDRYIWLLNGNDVLRDCPNPYHDMVNLSRWVHIVDAHTQNRSYGIGDGKPNEINQRMMSDALSLLFQTWAYATQPAMLFRVKNAEGQGIDMDDLLMSLGHRVPVVDDGSGRPLDDYTEPLVGPQVTRDQYQILPILDNLGNMASKQYQPMRGEPATGQHTLGEIGLAQAAGDTITEATVRLSEEVFVDSFRKKTLAIIDGYATMEDLIPIVGEEKAFKIFTMNPSRVPGGVSLTLRGSDGISNLQFRQKAMLELEPVLMDAIAKGSPEYARALLKSFRFNAQEIEDIIGPLQFRMEQQQAMQQADLELRQREAAAQNQQGMIDKSIAVNQEREKNAKDVEIAKIRANATASKPSNGKKAARSRPINRMAYRGMLQ